MKITKTGITKVAVGAGIAGFIAISGVKENTRSKVGETLEHLSESHATKIKHRRNDPKLSEKQQTLMIQIQARIKTLSGNIENNKRLHGFFGVPWRKLPLFGDTNTRLREIQEKLQTTDDENELSKIDTELKRLMVEFHVIMKEDEEEILEELDDGISYISYGDIEHIQSYMRECLGLIKRELTVGDISADYTAISGTELDGMMEEFINETDEKKSKKILKQLVNHYRDLYTGEDSKLALHHLTEMGEGLESGDSWKEWSSRWAMMLMLVAVTYIVIKKYGLPPLTRVAKRGSLGLLSLLLEIIGNRVSGRKKPQNSDTSPPLDTTAQEVSDNEAPPSAPGESGGTK